MCRRFSEANTPGDIFHFVVAGTVLWAKITGRLTKRKRKVVEGVYISTTEVDSLRAIVRVKTLSRRPRREQMSVETQIRAPGQIYDIKELFYGTWRWLAVPWLRGRWPPCDGNPPRLTMTTVWDEIGCAISFRVQSLSPRLCAAHASYLFTRAWVSSPLYFACADVTASVWERWSAEKSNLTKNIFVEWKK